MQKTFYVGLLLLINWLYQAPWAQASFDTKKGAKPLAMGGAFVAMVNNGDAYYYNPAGLWLINNPLAQVFYSAPFNMTDLSTTAFNFTYPTRWGNGTVNFESYGFDLYRETTFGLAYSQRFKKRLVYGIVLNYDHLNIKNGGSSGVFGLDIGVLFKPHDKVTIGFSSRNINRPKMAGEELPQTMSLGTSARIIEPLTFNVDVYKDVRFNTDIRFGMEYQFFEKLFLRAGLASDPSRFSAGLGFDFGPGTIDYAFYTHPDLGVTHAVSASIHLHRKKLKNIKEGLH